MIDCVGADMLFANLFRAFSGKVDTDLGFTRDRHSMLLKSAEADLSGFPQKMRPRNESRARFRFNLIGTRSRLARAADSASGSSSCPECTVDPSASPRRINAHPHAHAL